MTAWPNFFIAGAPKAGTSALYDFVGQHPQVYLSPIKEPTFFARTDLLAWRWHDQIERLVEIDRASLAEYLRGPMNERHGNRLVLDEEQYLALFRFAADKPVVGEGSQTYFWQPSAPAAMAVRVPAARLVFLLRDPAERIFSQYLASAYGQPGPTLRERFNAALNHEDQWGTWLEAGHYGSNLARFFAVFPRDQIRIYLYEDYRQDPIAVLRDLFAFLQIDPDFRVDTSRRVNEPAIPRFSALHRFRAAIFGRIRLTRFVPTPLRSVVRRLYLRRRAEIRMDPADRAMVIDYFRNEMRETQALIGRDLSGWMR